MDHFLIPGALDQLTGGYGYDRRILAGLRELGREITVHRLGDGFPDAGPDEIAHAASVLARLDDGALAVIDGLALAGMADSLNAHRGRLRLVALMHHPIGDEVGMAEEARLRLAVAERRALELVDRIIATSPFTARELIAEGIPEAMIRIVPPGTDLAAQSFGSGGPEVALLCVGSLSPRKGHDVLLEALARVPGTGWRLDCVGIEREAGLAQALADRVARLGLAERVRFIGALNHEALDAAYASADVFVLASWHEGYGMVFAEALARGLPIVATSGGAVVETVPPEAGLLAPPGDIAALAEALRRVIGDPVIRTSLARGAVLAGRALPDWPTTARRFADALSA